nr:branched-chain amino acid ABC transporter permease [uncultured Cellulosilyticum sp.]
MTHMMEQIINGVNAGSIYALIALGYTMVYGIVQLINFAHGDVLMMGAYFGLLSYTVWDLPFSVTIVVAMVVCGVSGIIIDRVAYKPLRKAPKISVLITALGVSMFLENIFRVIFGAEPRKMPTPEFLNHTITIGSVSISYVMILTVTLSLICMIFLQWMVKKTKTGKAMRAVSEDLEAAQLMGVNVDKTISITFAIGSALAGLGGVLYSISYYQAEPYMGMMPGLKAFVAAVLGGIGILPGAMLGGFALGLIENIAKAWISSSWANAISFAMLIVILLLKPAGILGKAVKEKV